MIKWVLLFSFFASGFASVFVSAAYATTCTIHSPRGATCDVTIASLLPTQFAVGQREVDDRAAKFAADSPGKLAKYIAANPALVVIGPLGRVYVTDRQHLALALAQANVLVMAAEVQENLADLDDAAFWQEMETRGWVYLFNEKGEGPLSPDQLPNSLGAMKDDPYRGLAWAVRKQGGYDKSDILYADFQWANFFRNRVPIGPSDQDFDSAVDAALPLAHSAAAKTLPGWTP